MSRDRSRHLQGAFLRRKAAPEASTTLDVAREIVRLHGRIEFMEKVLLALLVKFHQGQEIVIDGESLDDCKGLATSIIIGPGSLTMSVSTIEESKKLAKRIGAEEI